MPVVKSLTPTQLNAAARRYNRWCETDLCPEGAAHDEKMAKRFGAPLGTRVVFSEDSAQTGVIVHTYCDDSLGPVQVWRLDAKAWEQAKGWDANTPRIQFSGTSGYGLRPGEKHPTLAELSFLQPLATVNA